ncbi:hypothetical protein HIV01_007795 [Lysobacter arenosi]|uniref:ESPR domain-containing protein n=1 Tax=Lysobacter arenosi TaxID=2795387 RepID=A0ABX7RFZ5_9GAMM|nr:ESPR-type extended signal peptide-containing protein [Lysobacter arenosi]QSX76366.1 hypothetical protein HIV01_007795 [Lysobacter arenosi]
MNNIFRIVFNTTTGRWVVASEMAKGRKKTGRTVGGGALLGAVMLAGVSGSAGAVETAMFNDFNDGMCTVIQDSYTGATGISNPSCALSLGTATPSSAMASGLNLISNGNGLFARGGLEVFGNNVVAGKPAAYIHGGLSLFGGPGMTGTTNKLMGLANGTADTDAVNVSQLKGVTTALGGGADVNADGTIKAPSYTVQGQANIADVGTALAKLDTATTANTTNITSIGGRVTTVEGNVTNLTTQINNGSVGLVKQDSTTRTIGVAEDTDGTLVDFAGTAGARKLTGVSVGTLSATSVDAVNGSQLYATNQNVAQNTAEITALDGRVTTNEGGISTIKTDVTSIDGRVTQNEGDISAIQTDVTNIGGRVTTVEGNVTNLTTQINNGSVGLVKQDSTTRTIGVAKDADGTLVDFAGTAGARKLTGVSVGTLSATSVDAVNGSQLYATNQNVAQNATDITALDGRVTTNEGDISTIKTDVTNIGGRVTTVEGNVSNLTTQINNGSVGLVKQDSTTRTIGVATDTDGTLVDFAGTAGARKLTGVSVGTLSATSVDAVNGSQLYATNQNVAQNATDITALDGRVTTNEGDISAIRTDVTSIDGRVTQNEGDISTIKTDVTSIDGRVTQNEGDISAIRTDVTNIGGRVTTVEGSVSNLYTQLNSGSVGMVQQAGAGQKLTVGKDSDGSEVDFANNAGRARRLTRVAAGTASEDAVNVSQLKSVVDGMGGGASIDPVTGLVTGPTYLVTNSDGSQSQVHTVGDAVTNLDGRVYNNTTQITNLSSQISSGTVGMVQQAGAGQKLTVGKDTDGREVSFTNAAGEARKLSGVAAGAVSATSTDAINGSQLHGVSQSVATALGGGSVVNADGTVSAPTYAVTNADGTTSKVSGVEGAITNLDGRVYNNTVRIDNVESNVNNLTHQINSGAVGLVQQAARGEQLTVGKATDGTSVNFAGTAGDRALTGVAAGKADNDAVNMGQLKAAGVIDEKGRPRRWWPMTAPTRAASRLAARVRRSR